MLDLIPSMAVWLHGLPGEQCAIVPSMFLVFIRYIITFNLVYNDCVLYNKGMVYTLKNETVIIEIFFTNYSNTTDVTLTLVAWPT